MRDVSLGDRIIDIELANELLVRLNRMLEVDPAIAKDLRALFSVRVPCSQQTSEHPTIQVGGGTLGLLGFLNGLVGTIQGGHKDGWGWITAVTDGAGEINRFIRTDK